jgi:hypothetical protein
LGGGPEFSGCPDIPNNRVETEYNDSLETFAKVFKTSNDSYKIVVNPYNYYFSRDTMHWLYYRQCAYIMISADLHDVGTERSNLRIERDADCLAIKILKKEKKIGPRNISSIERDLKDLKGHGWVRILGPPRQIDLYECLGLK